MAIALLAAPLITIALTILGFNTSLHNIFNVQFVSDIANDKILRTYFELRSSVFNLNANK